MRRLSILLSFCALIGLAFFWVRWGLPRAESALHAEIQSSLTRRLRRPVAIERVRLHPVFLSLTLDNLRVSADASPDAPFLFACRRWKLFLIPVHKAESFPWFSITFGKSRVDVPVLRLDSAPAPAGSGGFSWLSLLPSHRVEWSDGSFHLPAVRSLPSFTLSECDGSAVLSAGNLSARVEGGTPWGRVSAAGGAGVPVFSREREPRWKAAIGFSRARLEELSPFLPARLPGDWSGSADVSIVLRGRFSSAPVEDWLVNIRSEEASWSLGKRPWTFAGGLSLTPKKAEVDATTLERRLHIKGSLEDPFGPDPRWDAGVTAAAVPLEELRGRLPGRFWSSLPWRGTADGTFTFQGSASRPDLRLSLTGRDAGVGPLVIPEVKMALETREDRLVLEASLANGTLNASALRPGKGDGAGQWDAHLQGVSLDLLAQAGQWGRVGGVLGGDFALRHSTVTASPLAGGLIRLKNPSWGDHHLDDTLIAYFSWKDDTIRLHDKGGNLDASITRYGDRSVAQLSFARADGLSVRGEGSLAGESNALDFRASVRQASLRDVPFLIARYPAAEGRWQAELTVAGATSAPLLSVVFSGDGSRLDEKAPLHSFRGEAQWSAGALALKDFSLDDDWSAAALRLSDGKWEVSVAAKDADPALFREVFRSSAQVSGRLNGRFLSAGGGDSLPEGSFGAVLTDGRWNKLSVSSAGVQAAWEGGVFRLENLSFSGDGPPLAWKGRALRSRSGDWGFSVDGPFLGETKGTARREGSRWTLSGVDLGDGLRASARWDLPSGSLSAALSAKAVPSDALLRRFGGPLWLEGMGGTLEGSIDVSGSLRAPEARVDVRWSGARRRGHSFSAAVRARWSDGILALEEASVSSPLGGAALASGSVPLGGETPWDVSWSVKDFPLEAIVPHASGPLTGEGRVQGEGTPEIPFRLGSAALRLGPSIPLAASLSGTFLEGTLRLDAGEAAGAGGVWRLRSGSEAKFLEGGVDFRTFNDLRNIQAGPLNLFGGVGVTGSWRTSVPARLTMTLKAEDLWINQQPFDGELARVTWSEGRVAFDPPAGAAQRITGSMDLRGLPQVVFDGVSLWDGADRRLRLDGEAGPGPWRFSLEGHGLDAGALLSLADVDLSGEGPVDFLLTGSGSGKDPVVEADVLGRAGKVEDIPYDRLAATLLWKRSRIELRNIEASRSRGYVLSGRGEFGTGEGERAETRLFLRLTDGNLAILKDLWSDCRRAGGEFEGEISIVPGRDGAALSGHVLLQDGSIEAHRYVRKLTDLTVRLRLEDNKVLLEDVSGRSGKGRFVLSGSVGLDGFRVGDYDLVFRTLGPRGFPMNLPQLSVPPGPILKKFTFLRRTLEAPSQGSPRLDLTVKGNHGEHVIAGEVVLDETHFTWPPAKDAFKGSGASSWWNEFWREATWDVRVKTGRGTWYRNEFVSADVKGDISVQGSRDDLLVHGKISSDRGVITYLSQPFDIKKALLEIGTGSPVTGGEVTAYLSGEAERSATTLDNSGVASLDVISMIVPRAPLGEIRPRFVSRNNPGLSSERVFQRMLGFSSQDPLQPPTAAEQDQLLRAGLVQLVGASAAPFANRLARLFGIDMIGVLYEPTSVLDEAGRPVDESLPPGAGTPRQAGRWAGLLRGTGASAGLRLTERVFGLYKFKVDQTVQNQVYLHDEVQIVGRVRGNMYLTFSSELDARSLLGQPPNRQVLLEHRWRFGLPKRKKETTTSPEGEEKTTP